MSRSSLVFWDEHATGYDFGLGHPMRPLRLELTMALARGVSLFDAPGVRVAAAGPAEEEQLTRVHTPAYIGAVRRASAGEATPAFGLGTADNPIFPGMHQAASAAAGASVAAAQALWRGEAEHAVNLAGGLHHAMPAAASGFCVYNDGAVAIAELLAAGATRVAYVDLDAHHGDGVQHAFYTDPRVLTISLHETGLTLWPGTGFPGESGAGDARGMSVNVALPGGTGDAGWLRAFTAVVPPLLRAYQPEVLVTQFGCDGHRLDIMSDLELSVDGMRTAYRILYRLAREFLAARAWTRPERPTQLFDQAAAWLCAGRVLLPGVACWAGWSPRCKRRQATGCTPQWPPRSKRRSSAAWTDCSWCLRPRAPQS